MRVVGYLRVSTDRQAEEGLGLEVQEATIRTWARMTGHRLAGIYSDAGVSGANGLDARLGLGDAIADIASGRAEGIVVYRLDRLARDAVLQEQLLREVWRLGGEVFSTANGESDLRNDPDDPSRKLIRQILGAVAEYERDMIALRLRAGRRRKADGGGYAYGAPGYGTRAEDGALTVDADEQRAIKRIVDLRSGGGSLRQIAARLAEEGFRPRRSERWHPTVIARVLARQVAETSKPS